MNNFNAKIYPILYVSIRTLSIFFSFLFSLIVIKQFGSNIFGLLTLSLGIISITTALSKAGFDNAILKYYKNFDNENNNILNYLTIPFLLSLFFTLAVTIFKDKIAKNIFHNTELIPFLHILSSLIILNTITSILLQIIRKNNRRILFVCLELLFPPLYNIIILYIFIRFNILKKEIPAISIFISNIAVFLITIYFTKEIFKTVSKINTRYIKKLLYFSTLTFVSSFSIFAMNWTDTLILGMYTFEKTVGIYNLLLRISNIISFPLYAINVMFTHKFSELWSKNMKNELKNLVYFSVKISSIVSFSIFLFFIIFKKNILKIFGNEFINNSNIFILLAFGQLINVITGSVGNLLIMTGNQKTFAKISIITLIFNVIINFILIPKYKIIGAALSFLFSITLWNILASYFVKKYLHFIPICSIIKIK